MALALPTIAVLEAWSGWAPLRAAWQKVQGALAPGLLTELQRFLFLKCLFDAKAGVTKLWPPGEVDRFWGFMMTMPALYSDFSACMLGHGQILQHDPCVAVQCAEALRARYEHTVRLYADTFSEQPPPTIWPPTHAAPPRRSTTIRNKQADKFPSLQPTSSTGRAASHCSVCGTVGQRKDYCTVCTQQRRAGLPPPAPVEVTKQTDCKFSCRGCGAPGTRRDRCPKCQHLTDAHVQAMLRKTNRTIHCGGCGTPGQRRDHCTVCNPPATPTSSVDSSNWDGPTESGHWPHSMDSNAWPASMPTLSSTFLPSLTRSTAALVDTSLQPRAKRHVEPRDDETSTKRPRRETDQTVDGAKSVESPKSAESLPPLHLLIHLPGMDAVRIRMKRQLPMVKMMKQMATEYQRRGHELPPGSHLVFLVQATCQRIKETDTAASLKLPPDAHIEGIAAALAPAPEEVIENLERLNDLPGDSNY